MLVVCEAKILHDALQSSGRTAADDGHVVQGRLGVADCAVEAWLDVGVDVGAVTDGLVSRSAAMWPSWVVVACNSWVTRVTWRRC